MSVSDVTSFVTSVLTVAAMKSCATGAAPIVENSCTSISLIVSFYLVPTKCLLVSTRRRRFSETVSSMISDIDTILGTHVSREVTSVSFMDITKVVSSCLPHLTA